MNSAQFGDERLTKRLTTIVDRLSAKPNMSIPAAMNGRAEMEAAYRFFDNSRVTPEAIVAPHIAATHVLLTDHQGTPLYVMVHSASPHESALIPSLISTSPCELPRKVTLLYDKAADSQSLRERLKCFGVRLISPFKRRTNGTQPKLSPTDRSRYRQRWKVERTFAWLKWYRRLALRWEYHADLYHGFWQLACMFTMLKRF